MVQTGRRCARHGCALYCRAFFRRPDLPAPCKALRHAGRHRRAP